MPEPIKYSDLIKDDGAIQSLIEQLTKLVNEYEKAQNDIKASAEQSAKAMQGLSGATDEQRQEIARLAKEADESAKQFKELTDEQARAKAEIKILNDANREAIKIQQLKLQADKAAEGSYDKLSAQYRLLKIRINEMGEADEKATKRKREAEAQARKLYEQMSNLQKATGKYTLEVGHYENALKAIPGPLGKVIGLGSQWRGSMAQTKEAIGGLAGSLGMSTGGLMAAMAGAAAGVAAVVGAFKLWVNSIHETQATGDAFDVEVAGWSRTWDVFKKSVSTFDFSGFITGAGKAMLAARELQGVLDEAFERSWSTRIRRAEAEPELQQLLENFRDQRKLNSERIAEGQKYIDKLEQFYNEEKSQLDAIEKARLNDLFDSTNRIKYKTAAEEEAAKQSLKNYIREYEINKDRIGLAKDYIKAQDELRAAQSLQQESMNATLGVAAKTTGNYSELMKKYQNIIDGTSDDIKKLAGVVRQYNLSSNKELEEYNKALLNSAQAASAFQTSTMRIRTQLHSLEAGEERKPTGGGQSWSLQNDKKFQEQRLALLRQYQAGEIATREDFNNKVSELEITTLQKRLDGLKSNSSERGKIEAQLIEKQISQREKLAEAEQKAIEKERKRREDARKEEERAWIDQLNMEMKTIDLEIAATNDGTDEMYRLRLAKLWKAREIEIAENNRLTEEMRQDEALINAKYDKQRLDLAKQFGKNVAEAVTEGAEEETKHYGDLLDIIIGFGPSGGDDDSKKKRKRIEEVKDGIRTLASSIAESISSIISSWEKAADAAVEAADKQVESAQRILDSERQAAAEGYANNVRRAEKELALAKKQQAAALKEQEKAQKAQAALDSLTQAASLTTASANLWAAFSPIPYVGPALAVAAIATMWGSFLASKIKAAQVTKPETYGEGHVELLEGGSHASGNDISLGRKSNGVERRAEGGEFFAVINKRNSRRYRNTIPDVINSFNDGTFADKYIRANEAMATSAIPLISLSKLENGVDAIRKQGEQSRSMEGEWLVIRYKNLTRKVKS